MRRRSLRPPSSSSPALSLTEAAVRWKPVAIRGSRVLPSAAKDWGSVMKEVSSNGNNRRYWRANYRLILMLLGIWATVSLGCGVLFVEYLNRFMFFRVPFGFWMAQQGGIYIFVIMIFFYAWRMDVLDHRFHKDE
jgi:putative solute:sodium symporter small subunit